MCVRKSYLIEVLFKINVMDIDMNKNSISYYLRESNVLWHEL